MSEQAKEKCKVCDGSGEILQKEPLGKFYNSMGECEKCNGTGEVEWLDNIIPKKGVWLKPGVYFSGIDYSVKVQNPSFEFITKNIISAIGIPKDLLIKSTPNSIEIPELKVDMVKIDVKPRVFDKNEIKEDEIETCPKCNGSGLNCSPITDPTADRNRECAWCGGNGRISWLDKIYKRAKRIPGKLRADWSIDIQQDLKAMHGIDVEQEIITKLNEEICKQVEKDILDSLIIREDK
jgi:hypothetical protein